MANESRESEGIRIESRKIRGEVGVDKGGNWKGGKEREANGGFAHWGTGGGCSENERKGGGDRRGVPGGVGGWRGQARVHL